MEIILLVDDEAEALATTREMLTGRGYQVLDAPNGEEAARVASAHVGPIHLLLTKAVMPGVSGEGLAQQLRLQRPEMKVLYMRSSLSSEGSRSSQEPRQGQGPTGRSSSNRSSRSASRKKCRRCSPQDRPLPSTHRRIHGSTPKLGFVAQRIRLRPSHP
jgi:CheY-like chemotaxis protein